MKNESLYDFYSLSEKEYYIKREILEDADYEESYWGTVIDPDGLVRNRVEERERHLEDLSNELKYVNSLKPGKILDVGCGLGYFLSGIDEPWEKFGVEISEFSADYAQEWGGIFIGKIEDLKLRHNDFDVIVLHHVIEHVENPINLILEIKKLIKKRGTLVLGTPDFDSGCARLFGKNFRLLNDPTHISLFSNESMHRFLRDFGFTIDNVDYPFFNTRYFTLKNLKSLFDESKISPPFYGNFMTFYCHL
jgi:2-polyprenyl-3-methyl-5-hydroxy-6-metoxy-1,4-benzoquinol methylase